MGFTHTQQIAQLSVSSTCRISVLYEIARAWAASNSFQRKSWCWAGETRNVPRNVFRFKTVGFGVEMFGLAKHEAVHAITKRLHPAQELLALVRAP